jgi:hypothetical protein
MAGTRIAPDADGSRQFEVLLPRLRRPRLLAEIESHCAAAGVRCEVRASDKSVRKGKVVILTVPSDISPHAFAALSSWIYVRVGTRPYDPSDASAEAARQRDAIATARATNAWTSQDLELIVGRLVRREFLAGVASICASTGARWEWRMQRSGPVRIIAVTISGPGSVVEETVDQVRALQRLFGSGGGS